MRSLSRSRRQFGHARDLFERKDRTRRKAPGAPMQDSNAEPAVGRFSNCAMRRSSPLMVRAVVSSRRMSAYRLRPRARAPAPARPIHPTAVRSYHLFRGGGIAREIWVSIPSIAEVDSRLFIDRPFAYDHGMSPIEHTSRQRLIELLTGTLLSSHQLAQLLGFRSARSKNISRIS